MNAPCPQPLPSTDSAGLPEGFALQHARTVGSTNDEVAKLALEGAPSGTMLLADRQTQGRGRLGRNWQSFSGNLHASILLRPACSMRAASQLSLLAGVALCDVLAAHGPDDLALRLKWPNDVLIGGAKVAGILLESAAGKDGLVDHVIIGLGMNVTRTPDGLDYPVSSLAEEGLPSLSPEAWLRAFAARLAIRLDRWREDGFADVREAWRDRSYGLGERIRLRLDQDQIEGRFVDLTEEGAILIQRADGTRLEMTAGDVVYAGR